jgi:hypothetical protein
MSDKAIADGAERAELWKLTAAFAAGAVILHLVFGWKGLPIALACLSGIALCGAAFFSRIGHDISLVFGLIALLLGGVVSRVVIAAMYFVGVLCFGSVLRLFGMDRLDRDFQKCRARPTMLTDAPASPVESFRRQS